MKKRNSQLIKRLAKQIGFSSCGISRARFLHEEEKNFEDWLNPVSYTHLRAHET